MLPALRRAYSTLTIKSIDDEQRVIEGIASTPSTDRMGDVVEPKGAKFSLPLPLLWQHDAKQPIGHVLAAKVTDAGISITAQIAKNVLPQIDNAWALIKAGLVRGLSIGFSPIEEADISGTYGVRFTKWEWLELSAVTIPANADANIQTIKSFDIGAAASGTAVDATPAPHTPGVTGTSRVLRMRPDTAMKKSFADQIVQWENTRAAKAARQSEIQQKALDEGRAKDEAEQEEFQTLDGEVKGIDRELVDLRSLEAREKAAAAEIKAEDPNQGSQSRAPITNVRVTRELPKGILFARYAMCMGASRGIPVEALRLAKLHYPDDPGVYKLVEKTAVAGGSTSGSHYLDDMVPYNVMNDFIEFLRPGSIIGKFGGPNPGGGPNYPALNRVGFNQRVSGMSTGYTAAWKGEGLPALPSAAVTFNESLTWNCMSALAVLTKEAIRFSNPSAEARVRDDLSRAVNAKLDIDFVDPAKAASGTTSPASITNAVAATTPSGTNAAAVRTDLATLIKPFAQNNLSPSDIVLIMSAQMALQLSMMVNTLGNNDFPDISMAGGMLRGFPVIVSEHLTSVGSPSTQTIIAAKASEIYLADDGVVTVEASDQASIEMVDTSSQSAISGTGASLVSLWQTGAIGLMANREITWKLRRATAVQYLSPAAYAA
jgi:HK97 family phage major capsid protein/HK97 family phage prohead protease